uniref:Uncharacterized protein n=1 Tax=Timema poppense TaxID=170557 RepID=A0A7R9CN98_TIMPO|nr:unnamed protein product [Timema poppensis]
MEMKLWVSLHQTIMPKIISCDVKEGRVAFKSDDALPRLIVRGCCDRKQHGRPMLGLKGAAWRTIFSAKRICSLCIVELGLVYPPLLLNPGTPKLCIIVLPDPLSTRERARAKSEDHPSPSSTVRSRAHRGHHMDSVGRRYKNKESQAGAPNSVLVLSSKDDDVFRRAVLEPTKQAINRKAKGCSRVSLDGHI